MNSYNYKGTKVNYVKKGIGEVIIMLHNAGVNHHVWEKQVAYFSKNNQVIAFDLIGFGNSDRPNQPYTLQLYVDCLTSFINNFELSNITFFGNCIGGAIAMEYASKNKEKTKALILSNVCGGIPMMKVNHKYLFNDNMPKSKKYYNRLFAFSKHSIVKKAIVKSLYGKKVIKDKVYIELLKEGNHPLNLHSRMEMLLGLNTFNKFSNKLDYIENLPPKILFWGEKNKVFPLKCGIDFAAKNNDRKVEIFDNCGHLLNHENDMLYNEKVNEFLKSIISFKKPY